MIDGPFAKWPWAAPADGSRSWEVARRERVLVHSAAAFLCCVPLYTTFLLLAGAGWSVPTLTVLGSGIAVMPIFFLARRRRHLNLLGNAVVTILWAVLWLVGRHTGGVESATMYWLPALPLVALMLAGWRWAVVWTAVAFAHTGYYYALWLLDVQLPRVLDVGAMQAFSAWGQGTLAVLLLALGGVYEAARREAQRREREHRERLAASESAFRALVEQLPDALIVHQHGRILYANPAMRALFGLGADDEMVGRPVTEIIHPDERTVIAGRVREALKSGEPAPLHEERFVRPDGSTFVAEVAGVPIVIAGQPAMVAFGRDTTERKQVAARLMEADRMIAVGTLAAGVAHEINNPLAYVQANIEFAIARLPRSTAAASGGGPVAGPEADSADREERLAEIAEALAEAADGTGRIGHVVRDLTAFSRTDDHEFGPVDVATVVTSATTMSNNHIRHKARLRVGKIDVPPVEGSEAQVAQVLLNLLINGAHAIEDGNADGNEIAVETSIEGDHVVIAVSDTGCGIAEGQLDRIFDPFFTTKPIGQGTGLGLSISRRLVESMGGRLEVESELGGGSTFRVMLRRAAPDAPPMRPVVPSASPPRITPRVLVVDDDAMVGRSLERTLRDHAQVELATSGAEVLERLARGASYDVVFCDLMMPQMTGMDLYEEMTRRYPEHAERVVFLTGGAFTPRAEEFLAKTARPVIFKPFDPRQMRRLLFEVAIG